MKWPSPAIGTALLAAALGSCARTAEERQLDAMRSDIERIQSERDEAADDKTDDKATAPVSRPASVTVSPTPGLDAVQLEPDAVDQSEADYEDPQDTSPRPLIRIVGSGRPGSRGRLDDGTVEDASDAPGPSLDPEAKRAYDAALGQVNAKHYAEALSELAAFLVKWPDHPYADHAMYWRGECYFAQRDYARAVEQFEGVLARFPSGMKAPDALYKLALTYRMLGQVAQARASVDRLLQDYPQTDAARQAQSAMGSGAEDAPQSTLPSGPRPKGQP
jgi:tol-pal system protein YbgF